MDSGLLALVEGWHTALLVLDARATRTRVIATRLGLAGRALGRAARHLWLFAYGSLMWRPAIEHQEIRPARLHGRGAEAEVEKVRFSVKVSLL